MAELKVLIEGLHSKMDDVRVRASSSVTLVKTVKNIIVDTGSFLEGPKILERLKIEGLTPEDIDMVILTHLHLDHVVNVGVFKNAKVFCKFHGGGSYPGQFHTPKEGCLQRYELVDGAELAKDVSVITTPGHTQDMISVVVKTDDGTVVIAGDAFSDKSYLDLSKEPNPMFNDVPKFNESRKKILAMADYIVPGHGDMFKVEKQS